VSAPFLEKGPVVLISVADLRVDGVLQRTKEMGMTEILEGLDV